MQHPECFVEMARLPSVRAPTTIMDSRLDILVEQYLPSSEFIVYFFMFVGTSTDVLTLYSSFRSQLFLDILGIFRDSKRSRGK